MSIDGIADETYAYDTFGRINGVNDISYGYLTDSNLLSQVTRPNGVNTALGYESNRNLVTQVTNGSVSTFGYTNSAVGNRTGMSRTGSAFTSPDVLTYGYNDRSEVTSALSNNNTSYNYSYNFDPIGNRLTANLAGTPYSYTCNPLNQYTAVNTNTPTYDFDGNMLTNGNWSYTWNGENRLIKAENGSAKLEFDYDYKGRRIFKKVYDGETLVKHIRFVYNDYKLIEELDALNNNATLRKYTWQPGKMGLDVPLSVYDASANATYYYSTDANKNISDLTDVNGNVVAHYEYSPFGTQTVATGVYAATNPFRFSSEYFDAETGLVYYNYRYYSTDLGRWLSRDPIAEEGGVNLYGFVKNNVLGFRDYLGLECCGGQELPPGMKCCGDEKKGKSYNPIVECCCNSSPFVANKNAILQSLSLIMFAIQQAYNSPDSIFGDGVINYYGYENQCAEQASELSNMMTELGAVPPNQGGTGAGRYWSFTTIGGAAEPGIDERFNVTPRGHGAEYSRHHVMKVRSRCSSEGDCPYAGQSFIIDPLVKDLGTRYPTEEDFRKKYPNKDTSISN